MKKKSTGRSAVSIKREIEALKKMADSEVDFSEIPLQHPNDTKWKKAMVGKFYKPVKKPIALRVDADVVAWFKSGGAGYQSRINDVLRREMLKNLSAKT